MKNPNDPVPGCDRKVINASAKSIDPDQFVHHAQCHLQLKLFTIITYINFLHAIGPGNNINWIVFNPLPDDKFFTLSKLKEFADDNFKFDENGRKLSKQVENTVGKGEIARYKSKGLFPRGVKRCHCVGMG